MAAPNEPLPPFHLAFPCRDVDEAADFYAGLGCAIGRRNAHAAIIDFFGHQIVAHRAPQIEEQRGIYPRHFGVMVSYEQLDLIEANLRRIAPERTTRAHRFPGEPIEHDSLQSRDPSGNVLEFKTYRHDDAPFAASEDVRIGDLPA